MCLIDLSVAPVSITVHSHVTQVGSVVFSADSRSLYFTRILTLPRGIAYCFNRKSGVYSSDLSMSLDSIGMKTTFKLNKETYLSRGVG